MSQNRSYDVLTIGRSSIDLYSNDIGTPFEQIRSFNAYVGGSPTNIAVGCQRLGLRAALLTCFGDDKIGDFLKYHLEQESVDLRYSPTRPYRTSAVVLGVEPPDTFPLVYYRDNAADIQISSADVHQIPFEEIRMVEISGTALSREPSRSACISAVIAAQKAQCHILLDLDYRHDQWGSINEYQTFVQEILPYCHTILGTCEEILAATVADRDTIQIADQQISNPDISGCQTTALTLMLSLTQACIIMKTGAQGATLLQPDKEPYPVSGYPVEVINILGAGDAFAAGLIYGLCRDMTIVESIRFANACGAILVTQHGCANFMPTFAEVRAFQAAYGSTTD